jgi:cytochrome c-type biogenesis protein CcmH/NrfF
MPRTHPWICVLVSLPFLAYGGASQERQARIERLEKAVLAPCCYTQTVALHQSEIAVKMRLEIAKWVEEGKTDDEILATYAERYGDKVLVDPNTLPRSWMLLVPWAIVGLATLGTAWIVWRWQTSRLIPVAPPDAGGVVLPDISDIDDE